MDKTVNKYLEKIAAAIHLKGKLPQALKQRIRYDFKGNADFRKNVRGKTKVEASEHAGFKREDAKFNRSIAKHPDTDEYASGVARKNSLLDRIESMHYNKLSKAK